MGRLIPAGTGFDFYRRVRIEADEPPPPPPLSDEELELEHEMDYFVDADGRVGTAGALAALKTWSAFGAGAPPDGTASGGGGKDD